MTTPIPERGTAEFRKYAAEVMLSDGPWEFRHPAKKEWIGPTHDMEWNWFDYDYRIAPPPPVPQWQPWTRETCPVGQVVMLYDQKMLIISCDDRGAVIGNGLWRSYSELLDKGKALDGTPLGVKVAEPEWPKWYVDRPKKRVWEMTTPKVGNMYAAGQVVESQRTVEYLETNSSYFTRITAAEAAKLLEGKV